MDSLDRDHGGVAPALELEAVFAWDDPFHPGFHIFTHSEVEARRAHDEGRTVRRFELADWPFVDDPPDPL